MTVTINTPTICTSHRWVYRDGIDYALCDNCGMRKPAPVSGPLVERMLDAFMQETPPILTGVHPDYAKRMARVLTLLADKAHEAVREVMTPQFSEERRNHFADAVKRRLLAEPRTDAAVEAVLRMGIIGDHDVDTAKRIVAAVRAADAELSLESDGGEK